MLAEDASHRFFVLRMRIGVDEADGDRADSLALEQLAGRDNVGGSERSEDAAVCGE